MRDVKITKQPIELYKLLKSENIAASGGEAKILVAEGRVLVNGKVETQKRKKILAGDLVEFEGIKLFIKVMPTSSQG